MGAPAIKAGARLTGSHRVRDIRFRRFNAFAETRFVLAALFVTGAATGPRSPPRRRSVDATKGPATAYWGCRKVEPSYRTNTIPYHG
jgi:hypothetical protein